MIQAFRFRPLQGVKGFLALALIVMSACKDRAGSDGPMPQPTKSTPPGFSVDTGAAPSPEQSALDEDNWSDAKVKQLKARLPRFATTELLVPVALLPHSQIAHMTLCIETPITAATKDLSTRFLSHKWSKLDFPTLQHKDKRKIFNAESPPFRVNALLAPGGIKGCSKGDKQTKAYLTFTLLKAPDKNKKPAAKPTKALDKKDAGAPTKLQTKSDGGGLISTKHLRAKAIEAQFRPVAGQKEAPRDGGISGRVPPRTR